MNIISFPDTDAFKHEMHVWASSVKDMNISKELSTRGELRRHILSCPEYTDVSTMPPGHGRLLDVGAGFGITSCWFASLGYEVTAVEPSTHNCQRIKDLAKRLGLQIDVVWASGESMERVGTYDLAVFHASLHHCDYPVLALENAWDCLKLWGKVYVVSEPVLPFYRSKGWWARRRVEDPVGMKEYGGNEHIYRICEYKTMLRDAGFKHITGTFGPSIGPRFIKLPNIVKEVVRPVFDACSIGMRIFSGWKESE